jgi:glycine/D-amino acid oxidase-like deaminating enzyme
MKENGIVAHMPTLTPLPWAELGDPPWQSPSCPPRAPLPVTADYAVVGAGITGLSCAIALAADGKEVVLLDRDFGEGAACRSGGIILNDTLIGPADGFATCAREMKDWLEQNGIACGLQWSGCMELDRDAALPIAPIDWCDEGVVRRSGVVEGGVLDPASLLSGLAACFIARGGCLVADAAVTRLVPDSDRVRIEIDDGRRTLVARRVLVAVDATAISAPFDPWSLRMLTVALETGPLGDQRFEELGWHERQPFYTNDLPLLWGRTLASGGMLAGRELLAIDRLRPGDIGRAIHAAGIKLTSRVRGLHPSLADIDVVRVWAGPIARDQAGVPGLREDPLMPQVLWAGGYGGHGLAAAFTVGRLAAQRLTG